MTFNPRALLVLLGFGALLAAATSSNGGAWFHGAEALSTVIILLGIIGLLGGRGARA